MEEEEEEEEEEDEEAGRGAGGGHVASTIEENLEPDVGRMLGGLVRTSSVMLSEGRARERLSFSSKAESGRCWRRVTTLLDFCARRRPRSVAVTASGPSWVGGWGWGGEMAGARRE